MTVSLSVISPPYHNAVRKMLTFCTLHNEGRELHLQMSIYNRVFTAQKDLLALVKKKKSINIGTCKWLLFWEQIWFYWYHWYHKNSHHNLAQS